MAKMKKASLKIKKSMRKIVDISDLPEKEAKMVEDFVSLLKKRRKIKKKKKIEFAVWSLKVKSKLTREEIYDSI